MIHVYFLNRGVLQFSCSIMYLCSIVQPTRLHTTYTSVLFHNKIARITAQSK